MKTGELRRLLLSLAVLFAAAARAADKPDLQLQVRPSEVAVGGTITATVSVSGGGGGYSEPRLALGEGLDIVGTAASSNFNLTGGQVRVSQSYTYILAARRAGQFTIGPATVEGDGTRYASQTATVTVTAGAPGGAAGGAPQSPNGYTILSPSRRSGRKAQVMVVAEAEPREAYLGQQVTVTVKLLTQLSAPRMGLEEQPSFSGFWTEEIPLPKEKQGTPEVVGGQQFTAYEVYKLALFPTTVGTLTIAPFRWGVEVVNDDMWGLFGQSVRHLETEAIDIVVKPLPEKDKPASFDGAVGDFHLAATLDRNQGSTDDALSLRLKLTGVGNFKTVVGPKLPELVDFKQFSSSSSQESTPRGDLLGGTKTWEYVLLPKSPGEHVLPSLEFGFFDPGVGTYRVARTAPLKVSVSRGSDVPPPPAAVAPGVAKNEVRALARDINYIKLAPGSSAGGASLWSHPILLGGLAGLPVVLNAMALAVVLGRRASERDPVGRKRRGAAKRARARLKEAESHLHRGAATSFAEEVSAALFGYLGDRFDEPAHGLTRERIKTLLAGAGCEAPLVTATGRLLDRCDFLRFAPVGTDAKDLAKLSREAAGVLKALEGRLRKAA